MMPLILQWIVTIATLWSLLFCTIFTLRSCTDNPLMFVLLLPGCLFLWGSVVLTLTGLIAQTELIVMILRKEES
jgi:hypothetical protein